MRTEDVVGLFLVASWNVERGFGFVQVNRNRVFVHASAIEPRQNRGVDLTGKKIAVFKIEDDNGREKITSALTEVEFLRRSAEEAKNLRQLEARQVREEAAKQFRSTHNELLKRLASQTFEKVLQGSKGEAYEFEGVMIEFKHPSISLQSNNISDAWAELIVPQAEIRCGFELYINSGFSGSVYSTKTVSGWDEFEWQYKTGGSWTNYFKRESSSVEIIVLCKKVSREVCAVFTLPVITGTPFMDGEKVKQVLSFRTPWGMQSFTPALWPNDARSTINMWGGFDYSHLLVDTSHDDLVERVREEASVTNLRLDRVCWKNTGVDSSLDGFRKDVTYEYTVCQSQVLLDFVFGEIVISAGMVLNKIVKHGSVYEQAVIQLTRDILYKLPKTITNFIVTPEVERIVLEKVKVACHSLNPARAKDVVKVSHELVKKYDWNFGAIYNHDSDDAVFQYVIPVAVAKRYGLKTEEAYQDAEVIWPNGIPEAPAQSLADKVISLRSQVLDLTKGKSYIAYSKELRTDIENYLSWYQELGSDWTMSEIGQHYEVWSKLIERISLEAESAKELFAKHEAGEVYIGFEAWHRLGGKTNHGHAWVITPKGEFRGRDSDDVRRHKSDGTYRWELVEENELALQWLGEFEVCVVKLPTNGLTDEQYFAIARAEEEVGLPKGIFGFDEEVNDRMEKILDATEDGIFDFTAEWRPVDAKEYWPLIINWDGIHLEWPEKGQPRTGHAPCLDGFLYFFTYYKYGRDNYAVRWVKEKVKENEGVDL